MAKAKLFVVLGEENEMVIEPHTLSFIKKELEFYKDLIDTLTIHELGPGKKITMETKIKILS